MRARGRTIRQKLLAFLLVPLVPLVGLWAYSAYNAVDDMRGLLKSAKLPDTLGYPVESMLQALQEERREALLYLSAPERPAALDLAASQRQTDIRVAKLHGIFDDPDKREVLSVSERERFDGLLVQLGGLGTLRGKVSSEEISRSDAFVAYSDVVESGYVLFSSADAMKDVKLARYALALMHLAKAREAISRVDALTTAAVASDKMSSTEFRELGEAVAEQRFLYRTYLPELPKTIARPYQEFLDGSQGKTLVTLEDRLLSAGGKGIPKAVTSKEWRGAADDALAQLDAAGLESGENFIEQVQPYVVKVFLNAAIVGVLGLAAILVSIITAVRVARDLVRKLTQLRRAALDLSGNRLPRVMRRLAAGKEVDIITEVPPLEFGRDCEIGQVGHAFNDVQRAAVEAAVKQAELRRGISRVFVNLARRSQVLLHRQLTLLDVMEQRTEDAEELADLFKLDHMTTRMRRHAEGLVILSGVAPSRAWRNPVMIMDVVRAAVAEVEDYERVEVRRMSRVAVVGAAVGDITHLVAELVENATVFSPPHTQVQIHGERVANGFVLEIDDRGLGLPPEDLLHANQRLAETSEVELSDTDRLGLFVVSRLAQRHNVRVSLRPSVYGGTTAVVLVPNALLTEDSGPSGPSTGGQRVKAPPAAGSDRARSVSRHQQAPQRPRRSTQSGETERSDGMPPRRRRSPALVADHGKTLSVQTQSSRYVKDSDAAHGERANRGAPGGSAAPGAHGDGINGTPQGSAAQSLGNDGLPRLPRRVRQASLAPQLRTQAPQAATRGEGAEHPSASPREHSADEVRTRMASFQRGWQRGRSEEEDSPKSVGSAPSREAYAPWTSTEEGDGR